VASVGAYRLKVTVPPALLATAPASLMVPLSTAESEMAEPTWALVAVVTMVGEPLNDAGSKQLGAVAKLAIAPLPCLTAVRKELLRLVLTWYIFL